MRGAYGKYRAHPLIGIVMDIFAPFDNADPALPFVVGQLGQSLDGRVATISGDSRDIGGAAGLNHLHQLRARVDAVVVGASTILADDPRLTVRLAPGNSPARVVIDPHGRIASDGQWLAQDGVRRILVTCCDSALARCDETIRLERRDGGIAPADIIAALHARGLRRILVEGGPITISRFIAAQALDRLHIVVSPLIIGSGKASLELPPVATLAEAKRPATRVFMLGGGDVLFDCDMR